MPDDTLTGMTVLLVDDENFSRVTVANMAANLGRPNIIRAINGAEALDAFNNTNVDLVISDFNMPELDGLQLLHAIRTNSNDAKRATPFAMLTGYSERKLVDYALALGVNAFLIKPVSQIGMESRLSAMLSNVDAGHWLKDRVFYESIDIDGILQEIIDPEGKDGKDFAVDLTSIEQTLFMSKKAKGKIEPVEVRGVTKPKSGRFGKRDLRDAVTSGDLAQPKKGQVNECLYPLDEIPEGATLTQDIYTADGRLYLREGSQLTSRIISILQDLQELGHPVENIWIEV